MNEFFVGDDDEKESNMQGSLWLKAYWGLLRREWLTAQVFLLADSISASATPIHTTNHSIFCSPSLQIRNEMWQYEQHWDILSIYSSLLLPPRCPQFFIWRYTNRLLSYPTKYEWFQFQRRLLDHQLSVRNRWWTKRLANSSIQLCCFVLSARATVVSTMKSYRSIYFVSLV